MDRIKPLAICAVLAGVGGCSDPREASEAAFAKGLESYLERERPCRWVRARFPVWVIHALEETQIQGNALGDTTPAIRDQYLLPLLADAGLLVTTEFEQKVRVVGDGGCPRKGHVESCSSGDTYTLPARKYELAVSSSDIDVSTPGFMRLCWGRYSVKRIVDFTVPKRFGRVTVSRVDYEYELTRVPSWAFTPGLRDSHWLGPRPPEEGRVTAERRSFFLTDQGWVHEDLYMDSALPSAAESTPDVAVEPIVPPAEVVEVRAVNVGRR